ncbi:MAG: HIT family protein [Flavobacteriales bacterium]|nr:HIT family protein [Flavobacteriales bacterium]
MPTIFTKIINREIPCYKIAENDSCIAFLDISPLKKGHTLVVPKKEVDKLFDLTESEYQQTMSFAYKIAHAIEKTIPCKRIGVAVLGMEVPHAHIHLIPLDSEGDLNFANPKLQFSEREMTQIAELISEQV